MADNDDRPLIPQPHGGALRPFGPGHGHTSARAPWRSTRKTAFELLRDATPAAIKALVDALGSPDERVRVVASEQVLNRVLGKPGAFAQGDADKPGVVNLANLTEAERDELSVALATIARLTGLPVGPVADGPTYRRM